MEAFAILRHGTARRVARAANQPQGVDRQSIERTYGHSSATIIQCTDNRLSSKAGRRRNWFGRFGAVSPLWQGGDSIFEQGVNKMNTLFPDFRWSGLRASSSCYALPGSRSPSIEKKVFKRRARLGTFPEGHPTRSPRVVESAI